MLKCTLGGKSVSRQAGIIPLAFLKGSLDAKRLILEKVMRAPKAMLVHHLQSSLPSRAAWMNSLVGCSMHDALGSFLDKFSFFSGRRVTS
jgi:hypothetical protein